MPARVYINNINWNASLHEVRAQRSFFEYVLLTYSTDRFKQEGVPETNLVVAPGDSQQYYQQFGPELEEYLQHRQRPYTKTASEIVNRALNEFVTQTYEVYKRVIEANPGKKFSAVALKYDEHFLTPARDYRKEPRLQKFIEKKFHGADIISDIYGGERNYAITTGEAPEIFKHYQKDIARLIDVAEYKKTYGAIDYCYYAVNASVHELVKRIYHKYQKEILKDPEKPIAEIIHQNKFYNRWARCLS